MGNGRGSRVEGRGPGERGGDIKGREGKGRKGRVD